MDLSLELVPCMVKSTPICPSKSIASSIKSCLFTACFFICQESEFANMPRFDTMSQVKASFPHWFSPSTMRFFHSRVGSELYAGRYFISSEQQEYSTPRMYTVREVTSEGIHNASRFMEYKTWEQARRAVSRFINGGID